jgi:phosphoglycolate phosphatase-like HAD superfamily hydrolase
VYTDKHTLFEIFLPAYKACIHATAQERVFPGVRETLEVLHERRIEVHIITAAQSGLAFWLIDEIGLYDRCAGFHCHVHNKAAQIHAVIDGTDISPSRCLMMGDLPADVLYAKEAGVRGVGFANPDVPRSIFRGIPMDHFVLEFSGLLDLI